MNVVWTKTAEVRTGKMVRQSYTAAVADGLMCREVILFDEETQTFPRYQTVDPGSARMRMYAEAMCFVPTANGAPTAWVLESSTTSGERTDSVYSNALATSKSLYMSISVTQEQPGQGNSQSIGKHKTCAMSLAFMS